MDDFSGQILIHRPTLLVDKYHNITFYTYIIFERRLIHNMKKKKLNLPTF